MGGECEVCSARKAAIKRPKTGSKVCKECFYYLFEEEVHNTVVGESLFTRGDKVAIAASGGKDSTVLAHVMTTLNKRYDYGLDLFLLSVDEGITGYRDDSLETVKRNKDEYQVPLQIVSYKELYGWTMDAIVKEIGMKNNCTFCGVFRRQALDRGAMMCNATKVVTGHNADDVAETVLMNILRGDIARLGRCAEIITGKDSKLPRCKPFKYAYEKEIVLYAFYKRLDYFSTECVYSPNAYRGFAREFLKDLEAVRPRAILDIIHAAEQMVVDTGKTTPPEAHACVRCGYMTSQKLCKACELLSGLNSGTARLSLRNEKQQRKGRKKLEIAADTEAGAGQAEERKCSGGAQAAPADACGGTCECEATGGGAPPLSELRAATAALVAGLTPKDEEEEGKEETNEKEVVKEKEAKKQEGEGSSGSDAAPRASSSGSVSGSSGASGKVWGSLGGQTDRSVSWERNEGKAEVVKVTVGASESKE